MKIRKAVFVVLGEVVVEVGSQGATYTDAREFERLRRVTGLNC
jgi:hypothetical protein